MAQIISTLLEKSNINLAATLNNNGANHHSDEYENAVF